MRLANEKRGRGVVGGTVPLLCFLGKALEDAYRDLGYKAKVIYTDPKNTPQLIGKDGKALAGTAYVGKDGTHTILVNTEADENGTRSGIIGTIAEEGSHIVGKVEGRQRKTGTEELGLESMGRATNQYFQDKYKDNDIPIKAKSDGKDYSSRDFGEHVGDKCATNLCSADPNSSKVMVAEGTSKNFEKRNEKFNKLHEKLKRYCLTTRECTERNGVYVFNSETTFYVYHNLFLETGQREKIHLAYKTPPTIGQRLEKIGSGVVDVAAGLGTTAGGISLIEAAGAADVVSIGTLIVPSTPVKVIGVTGVVVGVNKMITGGGGILNGVFGSELKQTINPIRGTVFSWKPEAYDYIETGVMIGVAQLAPYATPLKTKSTDVSDKDTKKTINTELHNKINNRGENYYLNLQASKQVKDVETKFTDFEGHIINGEIKNGKVTGGHTTLGNVRVKEVTKRYPSGVYEAEIEVQDPNNPNVFIQKSNNDGKSTMFPESWTADRIKVEVDKAFQNREMTGKYIWEGTTPSGVRIKGYIDKAGNITSVFPIK